MKICLIVPIITKSFIDEEHAPERFGKYIRPDTEVDIVYLDHGPASIESEYDDALAAPFVMKKADWAEANGYDAVVVSCMNDPGVEASKEAVSIPVVGAREAAWNVSNVLGKNKGWVRALGITVLELSQDPEKTYKALLKDGRRAIEEGADVLILRCTGMTGTAKRLQEELGVPVLEGEGLALELVQMLVETGIAHSKLAYPLPPKKKRVLPGYM
jgi:allantoin racemase